METEAVASLLMEVQPALTSAVSTGAREHVARLQAQGIEFYGYALLPGEPFNIGNLVAVTNSEADIQVPPGDEEYFEYRFAVDEWAHWWHDELSAANALLAEANERFASLHTRNPDGFEMDEVEVAYSEGLLEAVVSGLYAAKTSGTFGDKEPFLVVWMSDSDAAIITESVSRLNLPAIADEFIAAF